MTKNPILDELHATRRKLLAEAGGTLEGLVAGLQERQQQSGRRIIKPQQTIQRAKTAEPDDAARAH